MPSENIKKETKTEPPKKSGGAALIIFLALLAFFILSGLAVYVQMNESKEVRKDTLSDSNENLLLSN